MYHSEVKTILQDTPITFKIERRNIMNPLKKKKNYYIAVAVVALAILWSGPACAHYPWVAMDKHTLGKNEAPLIRIGWGHKFPLDGFLKADDLEEIFMLSATGAQIPVTPSSEAEFTTGARLADGVYVVAAKRKASFYTKTIEGGKRQSKRGLANVVKCSWSIMSMKAIIHVGAGGGSVDVVAGHPLEIIPLANPGKLKVSDTLPIRILLNGKPYKGEVSVTYSSFSGEKNAFAATITTNETGQAVIKITTPGIWLIKTDHEMPYHLPEECDVKSYVATLTFEAK